MIHQSPGPSCPKSKGPRTAPRREAATEWRGAGRRAKEELAVQDLRNVVLGVVQHVFVGRSLQPSKLRCYRTNPVYAPARRRRKIALTFAKLFPNLAGSATRSLGADFAVRSGSGGLWNGQVVLSEAADVQANGFVHAGCRLFGCRPSCDATGQVRRVGREIAVGPFHHDQKTPHHRSSRLACTRILLRVPGARSSFGWPATVTRPGLVGCLSCMWLPRVATATQPSSRSNRRTSRIFMAWAKPIAKP